MCNGAKEYGSDRSRKMLKNEYLLAKFGFDTAENEPCSNSNFLTFLPPVFQLIVLTWVRIKIRKILGGRHRYPRVCGVAHAFAFARFFAAVGYHPNGRGERTVDDWYERSRRT